MKLYQGTTAQFIEETMNNKMADVLEHAFEDYYGHKTSPSEYMSWTNSLQFVKNLIESTKLLDNMIILEYELPYNTGRIDCILFGTGKNGSKNIVVIELKQWSKVEDCEIDGNILTFIGGANRMEPHPSIQVGGYHNYLLDFVQVFEDNKEIVLSSCVYCHNYSKKNNAVLLADKFKNVTSKYPIFTKEDFQNLSEYLRDRLSEDNAIQIFNDFIYSNIKPTKKLIEYTKNMIQNQKVFNLLDDQIAANNTIIDRAKKCTKLKNKSVIIVKGGPGTGKSVIALNALAELLYKGQKVFHATGSKAFTTTLRKIVGTRAGRLFQYFNAFGKFKENEIDVLIADEAHRIRKNSNNRFTRKENRSEIPQIDELIKAAKVSVFFLDENQIVRPNEVGSSEVIKDAAKKFNAEIFEFELKTQFRCSGSDGYLLWIDNTLNIKETDNPILTKNEKMAFKICNSPEELRNEIINKNKEHTNSARLVAGFCWPWSYPDNDGNLKGDIVIGNFKATWEAKEDSIKLAKDIPRASLWAYDPNGVNQVGSIYTIQGFETDYIGVIWGEDLTYDFDKKDWVGHPEKSADTAVKRDKKNFIIYAKNTYRTLLTRGMKGVYVYFIDKDTENYFKSRIDKTLL
jgi:DUF2075 family protein